MSNPTKISVPVFVSQRSKCWIAYSPALKIYGYSEKNKDSALEDFDAAIETFFHVQVTLGTLNQTLLNLGWTRKNQKVNAPTKRYESSLSPYREKSHHTERQILVPG